jgi:mRNA-degrading endonuclease RelE of RelBE toxin-antitoxin system
MISHTTERFRKALKQLPQHVQRQARQAYRLFKQDPYHPSLHFKQVHPVRPIYSVRISRDYRAVGIRERNVVIWFWIGVHGDYDELIPRL